MAAMSPGEGEAGWSGSETQASPGTVALVRRFQGGDRLALERLMERFYPRVQRIVAVRTGARLRGKLELDDVVQEVLLRALGGLQQFEVRPDGRLIHWLAKLAEREIANLANFHRAQKRDSGMEVSIDAMRSAAKDNSLGWDLVADTTYVSEKASRHELEKIVDECLEELSEPHREVILLRDYASADWDYIAEEMQRSSVGAVQQLHQRARAELSNKVQKRV